MKKKVIILLLLFVTISTYAQKTPRDFANKLVNSLNNESYYEFKNCFVTMSDINKLVDAGADKKSLLFEYEDIQGGYIKTMYNNILRDIGFNHNSSDKIKIKNVGYDIMQDDGYKGMEMFIEIIYQGKNYEIDAEYCVFVNNQWLSINEIDAD